MNIYLKIAIGLVVVSSIVILSMQITTSDDTPKEKKKEGLTIAGMVVMLIIIILAIVWITPMFEKTMTHSSTPLIGNQVSSFAEKIGSGFKGKPGGLFSIGNWNWNIITPILLTLFMFLFFYQMVYWKFNRGQYNTKAESVARLMDIRTNLINTMIGAMNIPDRSITRELTRSTRVVPYKEDNMPKNSISMLNFRPFTVRLAGYLGGANAGNNMDGVFNMETGITKSLKLGARAFVFDIDYLDESPCKPVVMYRDSQKNMVSINTGSIQRGMTTLANSAFEKNYDPVLVILYLRRIPSDDCKLQKSKFFENIAIALNPLSEYHLGNTQDGNFHNCLSEDKLFTTPITNFQKKFIVLVNFDTSTLPSDKNPKNTLHWWTNARIWRHPGGITESMGSVIQSPPSSPGAYVQLGDISQFINTASGPPTNNFISGTQGTQFVFTIALGTPEFTPSISELTTLLNILGIQCVPLDILALAMLTTYSNPTTQPNPTTINDLTNSIPRNNTNPLSFWAYGGWSRKNVIIERFQDYKPEGFEDVAAPIQSKPIRGYIVQTPKSPSKPSPTMNAVGGVVSIG